ncbi:hypothetical protein [Actimicrobium sp. CCI2.3]|uniref:hypothetical protein n=1 Tax=Actimicrobium sp. CCI2.3 TaxID=3048616 RepID=UPI002AB46242|nr:hypothetical protein [Actimicrobium sp. CCI2.3]MDY7574335.1 hypothetical protein [Actimicrobium sp. CCI2.3]MEB0023495.1 hypothetical protein [Actimicrobium sp. CCI2.3]
MRQTGRPVGPLRGADETGLITGYMPPYVGRFGYRAHHRRQGELDKLYKLPGSAESVNKVQFHQFASLPLSWQAGEIYPNIPTSLINFLARCPMTSTVRP